MGDKPKPIAADEITLKVAEAIGCVNDEQCHVDWDWRRCNGCISTAEAVVEIVRQHDAEAAS